MAGCRPHGNEAHLDSHLSSPAYIGFSTSCVGVITYGRQWLTEAPSDAVVEQD
jgi:hypothetical protein